MLAIAFSTAVVVQSAKQHQLLRHGHNLGTPAGASHETSRFMKGIEFKHRLRVCNTYPNAEAIDVYRSGEKLTDASLPYKACADLRAPLTAGDKLEFKIGSVNAGTFSVSSLPNNDAVLLLIIHRHDTLSTAVSFESHVFANLVNAQVAIIDTYKGNERATPKIKDEAGSSEARSEELRYNSVVAVNPGKYEVVLDDQNGAEKAKTELVALDRESYVVLRTGIQSQQGESFPEELVVFPKSNAEMLQSGTEPSRVNSLVVLLSLLAPVFATVADLW